jgi:adenylate cyclase class IV
MDREEKEIKIKLGIPLGIFLERVKDLGFEKKKEITQRDNYFDTEDWHLYRNVASLRTRQVNGVDHSFAFKKVFRLPDRTNDHYVEEIEGHLPVKEDSDKLRSIFDRLGIKEDVSTVSDSKSFSAVLRKSGFQDEQVLMKTRQAFRDLKGNEIVVDDVENVGTIIELECEDMDPLNVVRDLLEDAEWTKSTLGTGYIWLEKVKGFNDHLGHENKFAEKPDWNVWENEHEYYESLLSPAPDLK